MAAITRGDGEPVADDEAIEVMKKLGMSEEYARFALAMEKGEIEGDVVMLDGEGKPISKKTESN